MSDWKCSYKSEQVYLPCLFHSLIDVHEGKLILKVGDEQVIFDVYKVVNSPNEKDEYLRVNALDQVVAENFHITPPRTLLSYA